VSPETRSSKKRTEAETLQSRQESPERLQAIFDTAVEAIITITHNGLIDSFNPAASRLFGYSPDEVVGKNVNILMPQPYRGEHDGYLEQYIKTGKAKIIGIGREVTAVKKDGTVFPVRLAVSEVRLADRLLFTGFIEDLTERKLLEREAEEWREELERRVHQRTSDLARANEELEHFAHTISHDLRTPLRGIRNYVDFLTEDLASKISGESAEDLKRLGRAAEELDRMIQEILNYSRIGRVESSAEHVDLNELVKDIAGIVAKAPDREVVIHSPLPVLFAPSGLVRQIFQNLIENGLHYNRSEMKRVEISAAPVVGTPEKRWKFIIKDNGIGIEPRYHQKVFGMFQRLHTDADYPGTGIGLAAVRKAALHMGGSIELISELDKGTTFVIEVPETIKRE